MDDEKTADPRGRIKFTELILALEDHALGGEKMSATQVNAAIALLKKVLPDLPGSVSKLLAEDDEALKAHEEALRELE
jgi:hypothetical protein